MFFLMQLYENEKYVLEDKHYSEIAFHNGCILVFYALVNMIDMFFQMTLYFETFIAFFTFEISRIIIMK